jgi:hypothetical protein
MGAPPPCGRIASSVRGRCLPSMASARGAKLKSEMTSADDVLVIVAYSDTRLSPNRRSFPIDAGGAVRQLSRGAWLAGDRASDEWPPGRYQPKPGSTCPRDAVRRHGGVGSRPGEVNSARRSVLGLRRLRRDTASRSRDRPCQRGRGGDRTLERIAVIRRQDLRNHGRRLGPMTEQGRYQGR